MAAKKAKSTSHSASSQSTGRYANPFFTTTPHAQRKPVNANTRMTDWSKQQLGPVPPVLRDVRVYLAEAPRASPKLKASAKSGFTSWAATARRP